MSIDAILEEIRVEAEEELGRIRAATAAQIAQMRARAEEEAAVAEARAASSREGAAQQERAKIVNRARLEAERLERVAAEAVYQGLLGRVIDAVSSMRETPRYRVLLADFLGEALAVLPEARTIHVDPADAATMTEVAADHGSGSFVVVADHSTAGGLVLDAGDGRMVNNTIESRLTRADLQLRKLAAELVPPLTGRMR